jgi:hypothetical protein
MRNNLLILLISFSSFLGAQEVDEQNTVLWTEFLSFTSLQEVIHDGPLVYGASDQGVFIFDDVTKAVRRFTKVNGLNDFDIVDIGLHRDLNLISVGYLSGNVDIISPDGTVTNYSDIKRAPGIFGGRAINHTLEWGDSLLLACDFGIVVLDLKNGFFRDTWYIGPDGGQLQINQLEIDFENEIIYAATKNGVLQASLNDPLRFFSSWNPVPGAHKDEASYVALNGGAVVYDHTSNDEVDDSVYVIQNGVRSVMPNQFGGRISELERGLEGLEVVFQYNVALFDEQFNVIANVAVNSEELANFAPRSVSFNYSDTRYWIADLNLSLIRNFDLFYNQFITFNGPPSNTLFRMATTGRELIIAPGGMTDIWSQSFIADGCFQYDGEGSWDNFDYDEDLNEARDIVHVTVDPSDPDHLYLSSWGWGLLEIQNGERVRTWNSSNTNGVIQTVSSISDSTFLIGGTAYAENGDLWMTNSLVDRSLVVLRADGDWESFGLGSLGGTVNHTRDIITTSEGQIWINARNTGIIVCEEISNGVQVRGLNTVPGTGNLPSTQVTGFAEDLDGEIWVTTEAGLGVVYTPYNIFENGLTYDAQPILIETSEGIVERLFNGQPLTCVEVDGANKKWIGTSNNGIFYLSEDGTEQIHHFTAENSPLLSNNILDIAIEDRTGIVYIATDRGLISFKGSATAGGETYSNVYAYPNPVRPNYKGPIFITGLLTNSQVKITDVSGNLIYETIAEGGQASWDGNNFSGERASSGVYLIYLTNDDGSQTVATKVLIVN